MWSTFGLLFDVHDVTDAFETKLTLYKSTGAKKKEMKMKAGNLMQIEEIRVREEWMEKNNKKYEKYYGNA